MLVSYLSPVSIMQSRLQPAGGLSVIIGDGLFVVSGI